MRRFRVELETYETDIIEVEAENEDHAADVAKDILGYDWEVVFVSEIEEE